MTLKCRRIIDRSYPYPQYYAIDTECTEPSLWGAAGCVVGRVWRRRGGWWHAQTADGRLVESWAGTRREALESLARVVVGCRDE